jgi:hypothetical protein
MIGKPIQYKTYKTWVDYSKTSEQLIVGCGLDYSGISLESKAYKNHGVRNINYLTSFKLIPFDFSIHLFLDYRNDPTGFELVAFAKQHHIKNIVAFGSRECTNYEHFYPVISNDNKLIVVENIKMTEIPDLQVLFFNNQR